MGCGDGQLEVVVKEGSVREVTFEQRPKFRSHADVGGSSLSVRGNSMGQDPEAGVCLVCWRNTNRLQ